MAVMKRPFVVALLLGMSAVGQVASAAVRCSSCTSDGPYDYSRTCCETRVDADGDVYEYCRTESCLPGQSPPDKLREGEAPGYTRPLSKNPKLDYSSIRVKLPTVGKREKER